MKMNYAVASTREGTYTSSLSGLIVNTSTSCLPSLKATSAISKVERQADREQLYDCGGTKGVFNCFGRGVQILSEGGSPRGGSKGGT